MIVDNLQYTLMCIHIYYSFVIEPSWCDVPVRGLEGVVEGFCAYFMMHTKA